MAAAVGAGWRAGAPVVPGDRVADGAVSFWDDDGSARLAENGL